MKPNSGGSETRLCLHCGKVGPLISLSFGYSHEACLTAEDKKFIDKMRKVLNKKESKWTGVITAGI